MSIVDQTRHEVRYALSQLSAHNRHHEFEHIARDLARATVTRRVLPATGPVSSGGDHGCDFETYSSDLMGQVQEAGKTLGIAEGDNIAFCCTLQKKNVRGKIKSDVDTIVARGSKAKLVLAYCEANLPVAARKRLQEEVQDQYRIQLEVFDGSAIAELLAQQHTFWIAEAHLHLSARTLPPMADKSRSQNESTVGEVKIWNIPPQLVAFTGRETILRNLLKNPNTDGLGVIQAVSGIGGVGKTSIAIEHAHRNSASFDIAWWVPAENVGLVPDHLASLAFALGLAEQGQSTATAVAHLRSYLQRNDRWLIIFDNVEDPFAVSSLVPSGPGQILFTSRNPNWRGIATILLVSEFDRAESVSLLRGIAPNFTADDADTLASALGDLPLALDQAASLIVNSGLDVGTYLRMLNDKVETLLDQRIGGPAAYPLSTTAAWTVAFDDLEEQNLGATSLLYLIAWLAPEPVPLAILFKFGESSTPTSETLIVIAAIDDLVRRGLVQTRPSGTLLHRVPAALLRARCASAQSTVEDHTDEEVSENWLSHAIKILTAAIPSDPWDDTSSWPAWQLLLPHILVATGHSYEPDLANNVAWLLEGAATYLQARGQNHESLPIFHQAYSIFQETSGLATCDTLIAGCNLAVNHQALGDFEKSFELDVELFELAVAELGVEHELLHTIATNLALDLHYLGDLESARDLDYAALCYRLDVLGADHPDTLASTSAYAQDLHALGEHEKSSEMNRSLVVRFQSILGSDHLRTLTAMANLANSLNSMGEYHEALEIGQVAFEKRRRILGFNHLEPLTSASNLAFTLHKLQRTKEAQALEDDTLDRCRKVLGDVHHLTLTVLKNAAFAVDKLPATTESINRITELAAAASLSLTSDHPIVEYVLDVRSRVADAVQPDA